MSSADRQASNSVSSGDRQEMIVNRRQLLKALIAAGGAVTASTLLPTRWSKPIVEAGILPAHAQITPGSWTPTPSPSSTPVPTYTTVCDSIPGGGDITRSWQPPLPSGTGLIRSIRPQLVLLSGVGPVENIEVTMDVRPLSPSLLLSFDPPLPQTAFTDASGYADFGDLNVSGTPDQSFYLLFRFRVPAGDLPEIECGKFDLY